MNMVSSSNRPSTDGKNWQFPELRLSRGPAIIGHVGQGQFYGPYSGSSMRWQEPTGTSPSYSDNFHDITVADWFAMANTSWVKHVLTFQSADPNTYYNSTGFGFSSNSSAKSIAYQSYVAGSRQRLSQMVCRI